MIILTGQDLEQQGIPYRAASRITVRNRTFVRGESFSLQFRQAALDICKSYQKSGLRCLLVDSGGHLTIWRQDKSSRTV